MSNNATSSTASANVGWGTGKILTKTEGSAPNRVFTIQWEGYNDYNTTAGASNYLSFQLKLTETSNTIQIVYGDLFNLSTILRANQVGLRGATNTDYNNRTGVAGNPWNSTSAGTTNSASVSRDNVNFPPSGLTFMWTPPTCLPPVSLTATNITTNSAILNWTSDGTLFDIEWGLKGFVQGSGTTINGLVSNSYSLSSLTSNTSYSFYVRKDCGAADGLSIWSGPYIFKTLCDVGTEFSENFDSYATGSSNPLPDCWSRFGSTGSSYISTGSNDPLSAPNRLYLTGSTIESSIGATSGIAVMPAVSNLQAGTHRLKFKAYATSVDKSLEIGYYQTAGDATSFTLLNAFPMPSVVLANAEEFIYPLAADLIPAGVQSLVFRVNGAAYTTATTIYIDDVVWEPIPGCSDISAVQINVVGDDFVDLQWTGDSSVTAWQYAYAESTVTDPSSLTPFSFDGFPFLTLEGLTPNTNYNLWIRSNCGNGSFGTWSEVQNFTTKCAAVNFFSENFDSSLTGATNPLPNCWLRAGNGSTYVTDGGVAPNTPPNRLYMSANGTASTPTVSIAIMPKISGLNAGTHRLQFRAYANAANKTIEIGYYDDVEDLTSYHALKTIDIIGTSSQTATVFTYIPLSSEIPAGITALAFKNAGLPTATDVYIDDVVWEVIPACSDLGAIVFEGATSTTASISWTPGGSETAWEYVYALATETDPSTLTPVAVSGDPQAIIPGLLPVTTYKVWVRSSCGTSFGNFSLPTTFMTGCAPVELFSENFDSSPVGPANPLPQCWERAGNGSVYTVFGGALPATAPNRLFMSASGVTPTQAFAIMPPVSNLQANTHRLKFNAYSSSTDRYLEIGYFTDSANLEFELLETFNLPGTLASSAETFFYDPQNNIPAGIKSLVFRNPGILTSSTSLFIDDVIWEAKPTVVPTCTPNVVASPNATCGNFATVITWDANLNTDGYYLTIGTTSGAINILNNEDLGLITSYEFIGELNTTYFYTLTPYNSIGTATGCVEQTFTTATTGCYCTAQPTSNTGAGVTNVLLGTQNFINGDVTYFDHTAIPVDLTQGVDSNLKISFSISSSDYNTSVWIDLNNNFAFEENELFFQGIGTTTTETNLPQDASFFMPATAPLGMHRMRIVTTNVLQNPVNPCYTGSAGVALDFTVNVVSTSTCLVPSGLNIDNTTLTTNAVSINWVAPATTVAQGYEYYVTSESSVPTSATVPTGSVAAGITSANLTMLTSNTTYNFYVRSLCSTSETSEWSQAGIFTTLCEVSALPYLIDFEAATVPNLPMCTINQNVGTGNDWITINNPGSGFTNNALMYNLHLSNDANTWFFTNVVNLVANTAYSISYKYGTNSTSPDSEKMKVAYGTSANSSEMNNLLVNHSSISGTTPQNNAVTFTPLVSGPYVFGFNVYSAANQSRLFLDDILIQEALGTVGFNNSNFSAYPNPVKNNLTIRYNENIKNATVFNLLGQQLFVKNINATEGKIDMSNLPSGTYLIKLNSVDKVQTIKVIKE